MAQSKSKLKIILYLIVSDFFIGLNSQQQSDAIRRSSTIGRAGGSKVVERLQSSDVTSGLQQPVQTSSNINQQNQIEPPSNTVATNEPELTTSNLVHTARPTIATANVNPQLGITTATTPRVIVSGDTDIIDQFEEAERETQRLNETPIIDRMNWGYVFEKEQEVLPRVTYKDKFEDQDYLVSAASHGLFFHKFGDAYIFHDQFDHFIKYILPQRQDVFINFGRSDCRIFIRKAFACLSPNGTEVPQDLRIYKICDTLEEYSSLQVDTLRDIVREAYSQFETRIRDKKAAVVVPAIIVGSAIVAGLLSFAGGVVGGYFGAKHYGKELYKKMHELEREVATNNLVTKINSEILAGLSQNMADLEKDLNMKIWALGHNNQAQIVIMENIIGNMSVEIEMDRRLREVETLLMNYINSRLASYRNIMHLEMDRVREWDEIFNVLRTGRIPRQLISYNQLKGLLKEIYESLQGLFDFAIPDSDFPLYYNLPIVSHAIVQNGTDQILYIHLRVPLKQVRVNNKFHIISPSAHSFPCLNDTCILSEGIKRNVLQKFDLDQTSLLVNPVTFQVQHEINLDYLDCKDAGNSKVCYTFHPTMLHKPSSCLDAIYHWNETEIVEWCRFREERKEHYKVIPIQYNQYMIHRDIVPYFSQICADGVMHKIHLESWAETLDIPEFCEIFIDQTQQKLYGPFAKVLRSTSYKGHNTYQSELISLIFEKYANISEIPIPEYSPSRMTRSLEENFKLSRNATNYMISQLDSGELSKIHIFNVKTQAILKDAMKVLDQKVNTYRYTGTFWGYISLIGDSIQMLTSLTVIFGMLSYTNIFGMVGTTLVLITPKVKAWDLQLIPDIKFFPEINIDVLEDTASVAFFMNVAFVFVFLILTLLFVMSGHFREVRISQHYGVGNPTVWSNEDRTTWDSDAPCTLMVNLTFQSNHLFYIKMELIHIKLRLDGIFKPTIKEIIVKNDFIYWGLIYENKELAIQLSEVIHLIGLDEQGMRIDEQDYAVHLPIIRTNFNSKPEPDALKRKGSYGFASLSTIVKRRPANQQMGLPRYVRTLPPIREEEEVV
jgi:hypothetical protein